MGIQAKCRDLLMMETVSVRQLSELIGTLTASVMAVLTASLHYRQLQMLKSKGLLIGGQNNNTKIQLTPEAKMEMRWWMHYLGQSNGKAIITPAPDLIITKDSSMKCCGAVCNGVTTQGLLNTQERKEHINALELKAAMFALKAFVKTDKINHVHLRVDNTTTVAQINKMGGTRSQKLFMITRELWQYCISKQIIVTAEHLLGVLNEIADRESRVFHDPSAWKLLSTILVQIERVLGTTDVDLFADRLTTQKSRYISWKPDPGAMAIDAFSVKWN